MAEPVTAVEGYLAQRRWKLRVLIILLAVLIGLLVVLAGVGAWALMRISGHATPTYASAEEHFKYGSIGAEPASGVPYAIWKALPALYPAEFEGRNDYSAFGFIYETDAKGRQRDLPIGVSRRQVQGVDVVWLNCATCHTGTWRANAHAARRVVAGMPSNNLDFNRFVGVLLEAAADERLEYAQLEPAMETAGTRFDWFDKILWQAGVMPRFREGLLRVRGRLEPLIARQSPWGPGRVDTFNPYKLLQFGTPAASLSEAEVYGVSDFPAIFHQRPREGMELHWDGNNTSLQERNLSAAIGAGVTPKTVDHAAIGRVAAWLLDLDAPKSPHTPPAGAVARGRVIYAAQCASCHGEEGADGYVFRGEYLGKVTPIDAVGTDRARLDSYTEPFRRQQLDRMFTGTPYQFKTFRKTNGYANQPLDALWLRGPYLHNGSVPTLNDLLNVPAARPTAFLRGRDQDVIDPVNGGFVTRTCDPAAKPPAGTLCFDTTRPGNGNGGHLYGTGLAPADKADLISYLLTF
ncbi:MAG: c-type cytochrome [Phenylobacterium sp.]